MAIPLPPDPYKALGVEPTAPEGDIRKVYLKLVLKCHPDKIQDPTLRAQKTDEFHRIQEAWDLLSDKAKREDYDEKVKMNARANAMRGSAGQGRQTRGGGYAQPAPAGYNTYEFKETANANIYTAEPRQGSSRRRDPSPPIRVYTQPTTRTRSYEDELPSRYDDEPRMRKSASTDHSSRKPAGATMERERRRADEDRERERERYEKERKKKEYSSSQKSRDKEKRSRTEEKTSRKTFIVDDSPEEYEPRRSSKKDRGSESLMNDFDRMHISTSNYEGDPKEINAMQYISASRSKATRGGVPIVPPAPQAVRHEEFRPQSVRRAETFSTYPMPQPSRPYYPDEQEVVHRSSARPSSRRPSADAASPRSSDPSGPRIVTAEPSFARKPTLQHHNSAPPVFVDRLPTRSQTINDPSRRSSANTERAMPPRSQTFNDKYASPLKQSTRAHYSSDSSSSDSEEGPYVRSTRRPEPTKRPSVQKVYKVQSSGGKFQAVVEEEPPRQTPMFVRKRSSSPRRSSERPHMSSRTTSSARPKVNSSSSRAYYDGQPSTSSRREVPGNTKTAGGSYFGEIPVKYADYGDGQYSSKYDGRGASNVPQFAHYTRREAVN